MPSRLMASPELSVQVGAPARTPPKPADINLSIVGHSAEIPFSAADISTAYGFSKPLAKYKNQQYMLRASILGTKKERAKVDKQCKKSDFELTEETFGCAYVALKKSLADAEELPKKKSKKIKSPKPPRASQIQEVADWEKLQQFDYRSLMPILRVETPEEAKIFVTFAQASKCKTPNPTAALISQMESLLPSGEAWPLIDAAYAAIADCTPFESVYHETLHQRIGLLNVLRKKYEPAKEAFNRALLAANPKEENRTLFWRGLLENNLEEIPPNLKWNKFWERLTQSHPLTQHAVIVHGIFAEHPISRKNEQDLPRLSPHGGNEWDSINLTNFIYLNFVAQNDKKTARAFTEKIEGKVTPNNLGPAMFLSAALRKGGNYRESMRVIYAAAKYTGANAINPEIIKLLYPELYVKEVATHAKSLEVPFVLSLMRQESSFNPKAESPRGAMGLMQVLPSTAQGTRKKKSPPMNLRDPNTNIAAGCSYLRQQIKRFDNSEISTLAAYNAGPTITTRWLERYKGAPPLLWADLIPYPETRSYVSGILRGRFWYRYILSGSSDQTNAVQELAFAERILEMRLSPNLASRQSPTGPLSFLARASAPENSANESEEPLYNEDF